VIVARPSPSRRPMPGAPAPRQMRGYGESTEIGAVTTSYMANDGGLWPAIAAGVLTGVLVWGLERWFLRPVFGVE
jgi:hypothetical protein